VNKSKFGDPCYTPEEINEWMGDVEVDMWNMQKVIDFEKYGLNPTYWTNMIYTSNLLDPRLIITNYIYIAKHTFDNVDSWLPFTSDVIGWYYAIGRQF